MYFVGVCGPSGGGKTTVCKKVLESIGSSRVSVISLDSFYKGLTEAEQADVKNYNFDHPNAFDFDGVREVLNQLRQTGEAVVPEYCFKTHSRLPDSGTLIKNCDVLVLEGILVLHEEFVRDLFDLTLFVDTPLDTCLIRRIKRDIAERGRTLESVLDQYERTVKPSYDNFIFPLKKYADVIIPRGGHNKKAIEMVTLHIRERLPERNPNKSPTETKKLAWDVARSQSNSPIMPNSPMSPPQKK